ncbi:hypothetical protein ACIBCT_00775 [Streptosporangium sp. NPDC050855]|uniref:hypothetical protein n=1 Tax=Streptosporangium sp. NPDC050855 TaxID=3366194 RepID=UPI0037986B93
MKKPPSTIASAWELVSNPSLTPGSSTNGSSWTPYKARKLQVLQKGIRRFES